MLYSFYGPNTRSDFLCHFLDTATPIKSVIDGHFKGFCSSDLANLLIINCKCRGLCEST